MSAGLVHDTWSTALDDSNAAFCLHFVDELILEVIDTMHNIDHGRHVCDKHCAHHRMLGYQLEDGHLWHIGDGKSTRAHTRLECVSQVEGKELAWVEHKSDGHFGWDLIKILLLD